MDLAEADLFRFINSQLILQFSLLWCVHIFAPRRSKTIKLYSSISSINLNNMKSSPRLNPYWMSGFTDAECTLQSKFSSLKVIALVDVFSRSLEFHCIKKMRFY
jgi:hypothetical protein